MWSLSLLQMLSPLLLAAQSAKGSPSYVKHGDDWIEGSCASDWMMSPVNFDFMMEQPQGSNFSYNYVPQPHNFEVFNDGKVLSARMRHGSGGVFHARQWWDVSRIDFHSPAEHLFSGKRRDLEVQLIHSHPKSRGKYVIVSLTFMAAANPLEDSPIEAKTVSVTAKIKEKFPGWMVLLNRSALNSSESESIPLAAPAPAPLALLSRFRSLAHQPPAPVLAPLAPAPALVPLAPAPVGYGPASAPDVLNLTNASNATNATNATNTNATTITTTTTTTLPDIELIVPDPSEVDFNQQLQRFLAVHVGLPAEGKSTYSVVTEGDAEMGMEDPLDLNKLLHGPDGYSGDYFEYEGSVTLPPCAGRAVWFVRKDPIKMSNTQLKFFYENLQSFSNGAGNYRNVRPILTRRPALRSSAFISKRQAALQKQNFITAGPNPRTDDEMKASWYAARVSRVSQGLQDYIKDVDTRVTNAARAHAAAFTTAPPPLGPNLPTPVPLRGIDALDAARQTQQMATYLAHMAKEQVDGAKEEIHQVARNISKKLATKVVKSIEDELWHLLTTLPPTPVPTVPPQFAISPVPPPAPAPGGPGAPGTPGAPGSAPASPPAPSAPSASLAPASLDAAKMM